MFIEEDLWGATTMYSCWLFPLLCIRQPWIATYTVQDIYHTLTTVCALTG
jgi:hypothetical protein